MFKLTRTTPMGGDCTSGYGVLLDKEYTVYEFIVAVLTIKEEWGVVRIECEDQVLKKVTCEYKYGEVVMSTISSNILSQIVLRAYAHGGYTSMDYILVV